MKNHISFQIAAAVSLLALVGSIAVSILYYFQSYSNEVKESQRTLLQLGQTVQSTASIAAYLNDRELANEVIQGLLKNEIVAAVQMTSLTGLAVPAAAIETKSTDYVVRMKLDSPFMPGTTVGELLLTMKQELINQRSRDSAWSNAAMLGGYTLFVSLLVFLLIQWRFIFGIKQLAYNLNHIVPGSKDRLTLSARHKHDEVGGLINNVNKLLSLVEEKLDNERALLSKMEILQNRFRMIYERAGVGIFLMDERARLVMGNAVFVEIIGAENYARILDQDINCMIDLFSESDKTLHLLEETFNYGRLSSADLLMSQSGDQARWVYCLLTQVREETANSSNDKHYIQGIITDITGRKEEEQKIRFQAERDPLTLLLNRRSAEHSLRLILEKANYEGGRVAVCLVDLDNFKPINDTHGHDAGDIVLVETSKRMMKVLRNTDLVARLGGDEFLLVIQGSNRQQDVEALLDKLLSAITEKIEIGNGVSVQIGASIGAACSPDNGVDLDQLMTLADKAMYQVKRNGKKGYQFYA